MYISLHTGEEVESTTEYNHMQLDCVSLYLLYLVQMISSGLEIIYRYKWHFKLNLHHGWFYVSKVKIISLK
jgi:hypothetical protein